VPTLLGRIVFEPSYRSPEAIRGIEEFSHLWLIFGFSAAKRGRRALTVRPPRLGGNKRVGVFATRSPYRPNSLGLSLVRLERIEESEGEGAALVVSGVDLLDGTPIYDIKPYLPYADAKPDAIGGFGEEMRDYALEVDFPSELLARLPEDKRDAAIACLREDPRPSYHDDERVYSMRFAGFDIHFRVKGRVLAVFALDG
jgi:tRNA-Thr(GGU) m(6)t(6)A37 methyltransferase TsaA